MATPKKKAPAKTIREQLPPYLASAGESIAANPAAYTAPGPRQARQARPQPHTAQELDQQLREREDFRNQRIDEGELEDLLLAPDPMDEVVERHREEGFAYGFMSGHASQVLGTRGYEVVKDGRGDPVKLGTLTLGKIPEKIALARRRKAERESVEKTQSIEQEYGQAVSRLKHQARDLGLRVLEPGEMSGDYMNTETGRTVHIG